MEEPRYLLKNPELPLRNAYYGTSKTQGSL